MPPFDRPDLIVGRWLGLLADIHVAPCLRSSELVPDAKDHPILLQRVGAGVGTQAAKL
jgi:hypothetical protein